MKKIMCGNSMDRMPGWAFRIMAFMFKVADLIKSPANRLDPFDIQMGQAVIDYGCGTGRYLKQASLLVGEQGLVYAVDIHQLAVDSAFRQMARHNLKNIKPILTDGTTVDLPSHTADIIYALDMFHMVKDTDAFLKELNRLAKPGGILYLEDGHQPRQLTESKIMKSACWEIIDRQKEFITCKPKPA
jgi:ubiquinone/menaquinone biosynthesis C-methylase UbiE